MPSSGCLGTCKIYIYNKNEQSQAALLNVIHWVVLAGIWLYSWPLGCTHGHLVVPPFIVLVLIFVLSSSSPCHATAPSSSLSLCCPLLLLLLLFLFLHVAFPFLLVMPISLCLGVSGQGEGKTKRTTTFIVVHFCYTLSGLPISLVTLIVIPLLSSPCHVVVVVVSWHCCPILVVGLETLGWSRT